MAPIYVCKTNPELNATTYDNACYLWAKAKVKEDIDHLPEELPLCAFTVVDLTIHHYKDCQENFDEYYELSNTTEDEYNRLKKEGN